MEIRLDDLRGPEIRALLEEHLAHMHELSPPESVHALDLDKLRRPEISFWTAWDQGALAGCGALKALGDGQGEIKSMRTPTALRGRGAGRAVLRHILDEARRRGYERLSLETGPIETFAAAHKLYSGFGFEYCASFGDYPDDDPHSVFMTLKL